MARAKITLSRSALIQNYRILKEKVPGQKLLPMLKANAYGHGSVYTAKSLFDEKDLYGFGVASFAEGIELRNGLGQPNLPIIVFSDAAPWTETAARMCVQYKLEPVLSEISSVLTFQSQKLPGSVHAHIEVNTGMNRLGISPSELTEIKIKPASVFTHLADAEAPSSALSKKQMKSFGDIVTIARARFPETLLHFANSSAIWNAKQYPLSKDMHLARPGLSLYGIRPYAKVRADGLRRAMRFTAPIVQKIFLKPGDRVGYGGTYQCKNPRGEWIAILGVGYADGLFRSLGGNGIATFEKKKFYLRGRVSMDLAAMSATEAMKIGDQVELWGDSIDPYMQASLAGTIPYELTTRIGERIERVYE
jgi:alanine racemase